jgi:RND family efflux transporter MFP subunit
VESFRLREECKLPAMSEFLSAPRFPPGLLPLLGLLLLAAACGEAPPPPAGGPPAGEPEAAATGSSTAPAGLPRGAAAARPEEGGWLGVVVARESVDVNATVPGRLQAIYVETGDTVRAGDPLALVDPRAAEQQLEMARSALRGAEADARRATAEMNEAHARNTRRQENPDFFSQEDLAQAELQAKTATSAHDAAQARVTQERARVRQLEAELSESRIRAPFAGRVAERFVDPGAMVGPGTPIVRLISAGDLVVRAAVPPDDARGLSVGDPVAVTVRGSRLEVPGTVARIAPEIDTASQSVLTEIRLDPSPEAAGRLQNGLVVDVREAGAGS